MAGHLDDAAAALNTAAQTVPAEQVQAASQALDAVVGHIAAVGGGFGQDFAAQAQALQGELQGLVGRLAELSSQLGEAATRVLQGGS